MVSESNFKKHLEEQSPLNQSTQIKENKVLFPNIPTNPSINEVSINDQLQNHQADEAKKLKLQIDEKGKKSIHHNFPKHTVTTIKKYVSIVQLYQDKEKNQLPIKLWNSFQQSKAKTRQIIALIFGQYVNNESNIEKFRQYGFTEILENYTQRQIRKAQQILRLLTAQQLSSIIFEQKIQNRRIVCKENFKIYIKYFCKQLFKGPLKLRMTRKSARQITSMVQTDNYINFQ